MRNKPVRSFGDCNRPFRIGTNGEARNSERRCFLLKAAGICDDGKSMFDQIEHFEIADGLDHSHAVHLESCIFKALPRSRMRREHNLSLKRDLAQNAGEHAYPLWVIDVRRSM